MSQTVMLALPAKVSADGKKCYRNDIGVQCLHLKDSGTLDRRKQCILFDCEISRLVRCPQCLKAEQAYKDTEVKDET